ncbi:hypothetical protein MRX96_012037 [Rhipicephalus microplus]
MECDRSSPPVIVLRLSTAWRHRSAEGAPRVLNGARRNTAVIVLALDQTLPALRPRGVRGRRATRRRRIPRCSVAWPSSASRRTALSRDLDDVVVQADVAPIR